MIPDTQTHFDTPKQVDQSPKKSYDFLITLTAIMMISGGYSIWFISNYLYAYDNTDYSYTPQVRRVEASQIATTTAGMSAWQTYRNEEYGFEFMYPKIYKLMLEQVYSSGTGFQAVFESTDPIHSFRIKILTSDQLSITTLDNLSYFDFEPLNINSELGGLKANYYEAPNGYCDGPGCSVPFLAYQTKIGTTQVVLHFSGDTELDSNENKILSTFKFIP